MNAMYPALISRGEDKRYTILFPDLPEAVTEGETLEEALFNAAEVLTLTLEGRIDEKIEIPTPSQQKHAYLVTPSARVQAALLIRFARAGHTFAKIARSLNTSWPAVARLEDPHHWPSLKQLEKVAAAVGKRLVISLEEVA
jgi:antitoxin HicB